MNTPWRIDEALREEIISRPDMILDDVDLMHALIAADGNSMGENIVDLRGIAMERLEGRLGRLEDTHRSVIAAAYDNLAGTNQINRAVLALLDPLDFDDFLSNLGSDVADILKVDSIRLVLESNDDSAITVPGTHETLLQIARVGFVADYVSDMRGSSLKQVTLRAVGDGAGTLYGSQSDDIRSEACMRLDFGASSLPGLLLMGSKDPDMFTTQQGTDLLAFFSGVFERTMRRWLA